MRALLLVVILSACATEPPPPPPEVPIALRVCHDFVLPPHAPAAPRTIKQFVTWTIEVYIALLKTQQARDDCARRLDLLNEWIDQQRKPQL